MVTVTYYATSCAATAKLKGDITKLKWLLDAKRVKYEEASHFCLVLITDVALAFRALSARMPRAAAAPVCP